MNIEMLEKIAKKIPVATKAGIRPSVKELMPFLIEFLKEYEQSKQNKELDELKAHCAFLTYAFNRCYSCVPDDGSSVSNECFEEFSDKLLQTPQQSLADSIKVQAIEEYVHQIYAPYEYTASYGEFVQETLEYANELREQAK
jgi:hypothetical protein